MNFCLEECLFRKVDFAWRYFATCRGEACPP